MTSATAIAERVLRAKRRFVPPRHGLFGSYGSWEEAERAAGGPGYLDPVLVAEQAEARGRELEHERTVADERLMQLALVLAQVAPGAEPVRVLDFGGGLGAHERDARALFPRARFDWVVVETPPMAEAGQARFAHPGLAFESDLDALARQAFDLIHASGALQYVPSARATWELLIAIPHRVLCLNRVPLVEGGEDAFAVQRAPSPGGSVVAYPTRVLGRGRWEALVSRTHTIRWEWHLAADRQWASAFPDLDYRGWLMTPRA